MIYMYKKSSVNELQFLELDDETMDLNGKGISLTSSNVVYDSNVAIYQNVGGFTTGLNFTLFTDILDDIDIRTK